MRYTILGIVVGVIPQVGALLSLPFLWLQTMVTARRLHDLGASLWWQFAPGVVLAPALVVLGLRLDPAQADRLDPAKAIEAAMGRVDAATSPLQAPLDTALLAMVALGAAMGLALWIILAVGKRKPGPNVFGEDYVELVKLGRRA